MRLADCCPDEKHYSRGYCEKCYRSVRHKERYENEPEFREKIIQRNKKYKREKRNCPEYKQRRSDRHLQYTYGMTREEWKSLFKTQSESCPVCGVSGEDVRWCVDHCHVTEKIRGILCDRCNKGIGVLGDTAEALKRAWVYLKKNG